MDRTQDDDIREIPGFHRRLGSRRAPAREDGGVRRLRRSQLEAFRELDGADRLILNSPTGWGKTTLLSFLALGRLGRDPRAKAVITVPQRVIGMGFTRQHEVELPDGRRTTWRALDLCEKSPAKVRRLVKWLLSPGEGLQRRVVVTTHASLIAAVSRIDDLQNAFNRTTVIIDEGHHVQSS